MATRQGHQKVRLMLPYIQHRNPPPPVACHGCGHEVARHCIHRQGQLTLCPECWAESVDARLYGVELISLPATNVRVCRGCGVFYRRSRSHPAFHCETCRVALAQVAS